MAQKDERNKPSGAGERWRDWQEHQYLPGYYTGGRVPPLYHGPRPNRFGWGLVVTGALAAIGAAATILSAGWPPAGTALVYAAIEGGLAALALVAGARLLARR